MKRKRETPEKRATDKALAQVVRAAVAQAVGRGYSQIETRVIVSDKEQVNITVHAALAGLEN